MNSSLSFKQFPLVAGKELQVDVSGEFIAWRSAASDVSFRFDEAQAFASAQTGSVYRLAPGEAFSRLFIVSTAGATVQFWTGHGNFKFPL